MKKYTPHLGQFSIVDACKEPGCPICFIKRQTVNYYLSQVLADYVDAPELREELCHTMGFCREHAWSLPEVERGNTLTIALMYQDILEREATKVLDGIQAGKGEDGWLGRFFAPKTAKGTPSKPPSSQARECPACTLGKQVEENAMRSLLKGLGEQDPGIRQAVENCDGICFPHIECALQTGPERKASEILINITQKKLAKIQEELKEFSRKHDYRFQHEPVGDEKYSWKRAINLIVGSK